MRPHTSSSHSLGGGGCGYIYVHILYVESYVTRTINDFTARGHLDAMETLGLRVFPFKPAAPYQAQQTLEHGALRLQVQTRGKAATKKAAFGNSHPDGSGVGRKPQTKFEIDKGRQRGKDRKESLEAVASFSISTQRRWGDEMRPGP